MSHWLFTLERDLVWQSPIPPKHAATFTGEFSREWLSIDEEGFITIPAGYSWNGCSPSVKCFDWGYIGPPNGTIQKDTGVHKTYFASVVHDALYQFMDDPNMPYTRKQIDKIFLSMLREAKFSLRYPYYYSVRWFG